MLYRNQFTMDDAAVHSLIGNANATFSLLKDWTIKISLIKNEWWNKIVNRSSDWEFYLSFTK